MEPEMEEEDGDGEQQQDEKMDTQELMELDVGTVDQLISGGAGQSDQQQFVNTLVHATLNEATASASALLMPSQQPASTSAGEMTRFGDKWPFGI